MQAIQGIIEQKRAEVSRLLAEIETLEKAQALLDPAVPQKRKGRPKGSKNKSTIELGAAVAQKRKGRPKGSRNKTPEERALARKASKKAAGKGTRGRRKRSVAAPVGS